MEKEDVLTKFTSLWPRVLSQDGENMAHFNRNTNIHLGKNKQIFPTASADNVRSTYLLEQ